MRERNGNRGRMEGLAVVDHLFRRRPTNSAVDRFLVTLLFAGCLVLGCESTEAEKDCTDQCSELGIRRCYDATHYQECISPGACLDWGVAHACATGETCHSGWCDSDCAPEEEKRCFDGDVYWYNSCGSRGELVRTCGSGEKCSNGKCLSSNGCTSMTEKGCYEGDVYWYDSCGNLEAVYDDCGAGEVCEYSECSPSCDGVTCSGHGECDVLDEVATCLCYDGYESDGLACKKDTSACTATCGEFECGTHGDCNCGSCATGFKCDGSKCVACAKEDNFKCYQGDLWWYDDCSNRGEKKSDCESKCTALGATYYDCQWTEYSNGGAYACWCELDAKAFASFDCSYSANNTKACATNFGKQYFCFAAGKGKHSSATKPHCDIMSPLKMLTCETASDCKDYCGAQIYCDGVTFECKSNGLFKACYND